MSAIWRQINEFGHQFTRFAGFYSDSLEFNEENEHTALKAQVRQIQKTGGETRVRSQDQFRWKKTVWCPVYPVYCFDPDF